MSNRTKQLDDLLRLSHDLGNPQRPLAILAEGNTSARLDAGSFLVKASGGNLAGLQEQDVVECKSQVLLQLLDREKASDAEIESELLNARADANAKKPSVEALFHAWLLTLPEIAFVGHTHAPAVNSILCSPRAREFAEKRVFPDEIVCCDVESVFVPYTDPGLRLAMEIRRLTEAFIKKHQRPPRVILLENHGIITLGRTPDAVRAAMFMAEKAAGIWLGAAALGGPVFLKPEHVTRIAGRPDEEKRRNILKL
jgi:rhamnose utilization protein RhaD (predicted bifunctional aldolase and dehydrogenase)